MHTRLPFKFYPQLESVDCGPACIAMLSHYYGKKLSLDTVKSLCSVTRLGVSVQDLLEGMRHIGFQSNAYKVNLEELEQFPLPVILHWKQDHFVVLYRIKTIRNNGQVKKTYKIADPSYGKVSISAEVMQKEWMGASDKGVALAAIPSDTFHLPLISNTNGSETKPQWRYLKPVFDFLSKHKSTYILSIFLIGVGMVANWLMPFVLRKTIDDAIVGQQLDVLWALLLAQLGLFLGSFIAESISDIFLTKRNFSLMILFKNDFLQKLIRLPVSYFDTRLNVETLQRLEDQERIQQFLTWKGIEFIFNVANLIIFSTVLYIMSPFIFTIFVMFSVLSIIWVSLFLRKRAILEYNMFLRKSEDSGNLYEFIMNMPEIKANLAQKNIINRILLTQEKINTLELRNLFLNMYQLWGSNVFSKLTNLVAIGFCGYLIVQGQLTLGTLTSVTYILGQLSRPVQQILYLMRDVQSANISNKRVATVYNNKDEKPTDGALHTISTFDELLFDNVSFKYPGSFNPYVLHDISFEISKDKVTAIVGPSGSGKTTIQKLILSFYNPSKGHVSLNNRNLSEYDVDMWRNCCGIVMQDGQIFNGTIAENIALSDSTPNNKKMEEAAHTACISEFIASLPMGYHTKVGSVGIQLSGGQKQRLLIARAIYKNPQVLLLDEATSSLDANNEKEIMENLKEFFKGRCVLIIAHRLSTVKNADNIITIKNGRIVETGCHEELTIERGYYYELVKNQLELGT